MDEPVRIVDACPEGPANAGNTYFAVGTDFCYVVVESTPTTLPYSMGGGRGNTLSYRRVAGGWMAGEP